MPEKRGQKSRFASGATNLCLEPQGRGFEPREDASAFHVFKLAIMIVQCNVPILMPVESNLCNIVAEFTLIVNSAMWQLVLI